MKNNTKSLPDHGLSELELFEHVTENLRNGKSKTSGLMYRGAPIPETVDEVLFFRHHDYTISK